MTEKVDLRNGEEYRRLMKYQDRLDDELRIVSMLSVQRDLADMYHDQEHMFAETWWLDKRLYHAFMLIMFLEEYGEQKDFWKRINDKGKQLIEEEKKRLQRLERNNGKHYQVVESRVKENH